MVVWHVSSSQKYGEVGMYVVSPGWSWAKAVSVSGPGRRERGKAHGSSASSEMARQSRPSSAFEPVPGACSMTAVRTPASRNRAQVSIASLDAWVSAPDRGWP